MVAYNAGAVKGVPNTPYTIQNIKAVLNTKVGYVRLDAKAIDEESARSRTTGRVQKWVAASTYAKSVTVCKPSSVEGAKLLGTVRKKSQRGR